MSAHPYRQKAAPYPVDDALPLAEQTQINSKLQHLAVLSPRFSGQRPLLSDHSPQDVPDLSLQRKLPPLNVLLATSSVSNMPINNVLYLKSDSNLGKHARSVSSSLSLFYDRENLLFADFNQSVIQLYLGTNSTHLMPRMKTIEMYRKNAKKSTDPAVLFQYAQYMLQTALMLEASPAGSGPNTPQALPARPPQALASSLDITDDKNHKKLRLHSLFNFETLAANDPHLRPSLLKEAFVYLKRLSDKGYVEAQYLLGDAYSSGAFGKVDNKEAFNLFLSAAKHGHTECAFRTAHCYEEGLGTGRDARKGVEFLKLAASKNHPAAMYKLGMYSFYARMGLQDNMTTKRMGIKWLERALTVATELTAAAPYELGKLYQEGFKDILIRDDKYALELFAQAAALGHIELAAILGRHYELGDIVPADPNLSIHYYTKAALGGHPESMLAMCAWYLVGSDPYLPRDEQEAFEWAKRAAICGLAKAQFALANFYEKGIGCVSSTTEAQEWYQKAAENGEEKALARLTNKDLAAKLAKQHKWLTGKRGGSKRGSDGAAQEKDCIIM